jgi:tetratricopeptide (TPR) repeat protein
VYEAGTELYLCRVYTAIQRRDDALATGRRATEIYQALVRDHPQNFAYSQQLYLAYQEVGLSQLYAGKTADAVKFLGEARGTLTQMAATHRAMVSRVATILGEKAQVNYNLRVAFDADLARYAVQRRAVISEAYEICDKLSFLEPLSPELRRVYADGCLNMALYGEEDGAQTDVSLVRKAEELWEGIRRESPGDLAARGFLVMIRRKLADLLAQRGEYKEASQWRSRSLSTARGQPDVFYEIALEYARMLGPIDQLPSKAPPQVREQRRRRVVNDTIAMLREAVADGFKDAKALRSEVLLAPIRETPEFQEIASDLEFPRQPFIER